MARFNAYPRNPSSTAPYLSLYPDDAYNPLAHVDEIAQQQAIYYYHTDLNAQPLDITDQSGQIVF